MKKSRKIKSLSFTLTMMLLTVFMTILPVLLIKNKATPPYWVIILLACIISGIVISALIIRGSDASKRNNQYNILKYLMSHFTIGVIIFWLIASFDILDNISVYKPVNYSLFPYILLHTIWYILGITIIWIVILQLAGKGYEKINANTKRKKRNLNLKAISTSLIIVIIFGLMRFGLRMLWIKIYGYYTMDYSRYSDIARFACIVGGIYGTLLVLSLQNKRRRIPFKFLDSLIEKKLESEKKRSETNNKKDNKK